jgi:hypothetical protein
MKWFKHALSVLLLLPALAFGDAAGTAVQVQDLKQSVIDLNRDLQQLEEQLLYPDSTQVAFFVSLDVGKFFELDAVHLKLNDKEVANYLYTAKQVDALKRGGVQRLHVANVRKGEHEIVVFFTGRGPHGRDYRRAVSYRFQKLPSAQYMELKIVDAPNMLQPDVRIREWQ